MAEVGESIVIMIRRPAKWDRLVSKALSCICLTPTAFAAQPTLPNVDQQGAVLQGSAPRLPKTFQFFYNFEPRGWRYETQISSTQWLEVYETGERSYFTVLMSIAVDGCNGLRLLKDDGKLEVFIPDDQCPMQLFKFRFIAPDGPTSGWRPVGRMEKITY
jgi:hypothetical protein